VKLRHAVKIAATVADYVELSPEERIALTVLVRMTQRVLNAKQSIRAVMRAIEEEDLNQDELFGKSDDT